MKIEKFFKQHDDVECLCDRFLDVETCCEILKDRLNNCRIGIRYSRQFRNYAIKQRYMSGYNDISHCPWCGTKLPTDLSEQWDSILLTEYGLDSPFNSKQEKKIPAEFLTDEWWKKRGL